jgi:hypothetical protein
MEILLIEAMVVGALTALVAQHKNRGTVRWGILGFLFSIFALFLCAMLPKVKDVDRDRELDAVR